ncbi:DMT family transporter [Hyphococcus lacteus]|uniref:DMT family transporter n=1 Tax=Hyphococcus lacteus TaxID=3143536 RepID=A0ABV3Z4V2_9PROT
MSVREVSLLGLICLVWGFHFIIIKTAVGILPPIFYAAVRLFLVAIIMSPFLRWRPKDMVFVFIGGLCLGAFNYAFMFTGVELATASTAAIAMELTVPFATILAILFLGDKPGWRRILGITLAFVGVAIIALGDNSNGDAGAHVGLGIGLVAAGAFTEAVGAVIVKRTTTFKPHELLAWFSVIGTIGLSIMTVLFESGQLEAVQSANKWLVVGLILYSALGASIFGHTTYYWLLQRLPISLVAPSVLFTTLLAITFGVVLLGDPFGPRMIIGGLMTLAGVGVVLLRNVKKQAKNDAFVEPQG